MYHVSGNLNGENISGNLVVQKCFDPRSDSQRWGPISEDNCEVEQ